MKKTASGAAKKGRGGGGKMMVQRKSIGKKMPQPSSSESSDDEDGEAQKSADSSSSDESSSYTHSPSPFSDGLDDDLMGDEDDQKKLSLMNEMEREAEMYKRLVCHGLSPLLPPFIPSC